jgi:hypothetical protein
METIERIFLERALKMKKLYESTPWWRFKIRRYFKKEWHLCRELMVKYGSN